MKFFSGFPKKEVPPEILDDKLLLSESTQASTETRKATDKWFLVVFGALTVTSLPFIIYTLQKSDINRLNGYDDCGNICGQENNFDPNIPCSGIDYTDKPYYYFFSCEVTSTWGEYYPTDIKQQITSFLGSLILASFLPLVLTLLLVAGFRYVPFFTVVGILAISWGYLVAASFFFIGWYYFLQTIVIPMIFAILAVIMLCVMVYSRDRIAMSIILFKESAKAISNIQMLVPVPVLTLLMVTALVVISGITHLHMSTAGILHYTRYMHMEYVPNWLMIVGIVFNIVLTAWVVQVLLGLQNMTISSAVAKWYSSRGPVTTNYCTTLKYHLGSAFVGSIVINLVSSPRHFLICFSQISVIKDMVDSFLRCLNGFYYSYIITASHGKSFFKSSKKARKLLNLNVGHATGIRYLGSFVIFLCQILVSWVSIVFYFCVFDHQYHYSYNYNYTSLLCFFVTIISFLSCYTLLSPIQVAYDTLFMCACEDILKEKHQHNSMSIKEFHSNAAEVLEKKIGARSQPPTTVDAVV